MLEAKVLRIGNLFIEENSNEIIKVIELKENEIIFSGNFLGKWQAKPIPITEDWLIKLGFSIKGFKGGYQVCTTSEDRWLLTNGMSIIGVEFDYIHELQNFFYCLTNQELKLNH